MITKCRDWLDANYRRNLIPFLLVALIPAILVLGLELTTGLLDPGAPGWLLEASAPLIVWGIAINALLLWAKSHHHETN
jgi:hypothetical protein